MNVIILKDVYKFIENLETNDSAKSYRYIGLLKEMGYKLRMPYSKNILSNIFELRVGGFANIRLIYSFNNDFAVIFHAFAKKTQEISVYEMNLIKIKYSSLHI